MKSVELYTWAKSAATDHRKFDFVALFLVIAEFIILTCIINLVSYTEIDWRAYMQEVEGVLNGTFNYAYLKGDTGPLVYPAGFVHIFISLYYLTDHGSNVLAAQWIFAVIYLLNLIAVLAIYRHLFQTEMYPPYLLLFLVFTAYRVHSIYVLRLFNDPVAMLFLYIAVWLFLNHKWTVGSIIYSLAVSVKMNILLFSPGLLILFLLFLGWKGTIFQLVVCVFVQAVLGAPFLLSNPLSYFSGAFNFGRVFLYKWTVNWRILPEWFFLHKGFHLVLLLAQLVVLVAFILKHWTRYGGLKALTVWKVVKTPKIPKSEIAWILFTSNLIGIAFSRSLHYQFYIWYFHSLPFLLWTTSLHSTIRLGLLLLLEWTWNVYPSTMLSSGFLHLIHVVILGALYYRPTKIQKYRKN